MNNDIKQLIEENFYLTILNRIEQNNSYYYTANIDINIIKDLFTVSPAVYTLSNKTIKTSIESDDQIEIDEDYIAKLQDAKSTGGYQRFYDKTKLAEIEKYIINSDDDFNILPNSIILSLEVDSEIESYEDIKLKISNKSNEFLFISYNKYCDLIDCSKEVSVFDTDNTYILLIPKGLVEKAVDTDNFDEKIKPILVIDGNHRLLGIKKYLENLEETQVFKMPISVMINSDVRDDAQIFTTINTNAKPVNPSYYYQIMGEFHKGVDLNAHIYLHYVVRLFNENKDSPLYKRIKMLGKSDKNLDVKQTISQAFLIDQLHDWLFLEKSNIRYVKREVVKAPVFSKLFIFSQKEDLKSENLDLFITKFIIQYFTLHKKLYEEKNGDGSWFNSFEKDSISLLKTLGIGAMIELIPIIFINYMYHNDLFTDIPESNNDDYYNRKQLEVLQKMNFNDLKLFIDTLHTDDFNLRKILASETFTQSSGQSNLKKLANMMYSELLDKNNYFKNSDEAVKNYINWYKKSY